MLIPATDAQVIEMGKLAVLASRPMGMGFLHHDASLTKAQIDLEVRGNSLSIDYYQGRMVKFYGRKQADGWEFSDQISSEYESWIRTYPSYRELFEAASSVGATP